MNRENLENIQRKLESITRKWWFFLLFVLLQFVPLYTSKGFEPAETGIVTGEIFSHALVYDYPSLFVKKRKET